MLYHMYAIIGKEVREAQNKDKLREVLLH